jgi:glycosyltransferase involved in cell wall biosynthesis
MDKPLSLKIKELIDTGRYLDAYTLATAIASQYPRIKIYKDLLRQCEARLPEKTRLLAEKAHIDKSCTGQDSTDIETFEYHLRKQLEKVRTQEVNPAKAWGDISFLAPSHWPKDPRLTRLLAPSEKALETHFNESSHRTLILTGDIKGGAGIAALRTFECLNSIGNKTDILYRTDQELLLQRGNERVFEIETIDITETVYSGIDYQLIEELRERINNEVHQTMARKGLGSNTFLFHSEDSIDIKDILRCYSSINIHWCDFLLTAAGLERASELSIPVTITLHDMYWLNGSCHYSAACTQFSDGCNSCPLVTSDSTPIIRYNSYHGEILRSIKDMVIISPSKWLCGLAAQASALMNREIYYIPNPQPAKAREITTTNSQQKSDATLILIYGALGLEEKRKAYDLFIELNKELLRRRANVSFKVFGSLTTGQENELRKYPCEVLGFLSQRELENHFTHSHAMLMLSHEDNYPNLCVEAAAAGLPLIASNNSGLTSFVKSSEGGILAPNDPVEIADIITSLSIGDINKFGKKIAEWYIKIYSDTKIEHAYKSVINRSNSRKEFLYKNEELGPIRNSGMSECAVSDCEYIVNASEYAVEILVPQGEYEDNMFSLSYTVRSPSGPLDVYIAGYAHEAHSRINSDGVTYVLEGLPTGKVVKLIKHDSISKYYYKKLDIANISTYPASLKLDPANNHDNNLGMATSERELTFILCEDSLTFESYAGGSMYWLLANKRYSLHLLHFPSEEPTISITCEEDFLITFFGIDLRHDPLKSVRLEINTVEGVFSLEPVIDEHSFSFLLKSKMLYLMNSVFLVTVGGEVLVDGREVVGLIKEHGIAAQ